MLHWLAFQRQGRFWLQCRASSALFYTYFQLKIYSNATRIPPHPRSLLGPRGSLLRVSWEHLGVFEELLGDLLGPLGASWGHLGAS